MCACAWTSVGQSPRELSMAAASAASLVFEALAGNIYTSRTSACTCLLPHPPHPSLLVRLQDVAALLIVFRLWRLVRVLHASSEIAGFHVEEEMAELVGGPYGIQGGEERGCGEDWPGGDAASGGPYGIQGGGRGDGLDKLLCCACCAVLGAVPAVLRLLCWSDACPPRCGCLHCPVWRCYLRWGGGRRSGRQPVEAAETSPSTMQRLHVCVHCA